VKVIFLDFDGVLNSSASFILESNRRRKLMETDKAAGMLFRVNQTLCHVCCSNFQYILDHVPSDVKIVISSTWREIYDMDWLKAKLQSYGIDSSRVIDKTPACFVGGFTRAPRGQEISEWLEEHPEVTDYVILDDNSDMTVHMDKFVQTSWLTGLTLYNVEKTIDMLGGEDKGGFPF
jgi:hypothetical protein